MNASPRPNGHTFQLLAAAADQIARRGDVSIVHASLSGSRVASRETRTETGAGGRLPTDDDLTGLVEAWQSADGIILGAPVFTYGPPSALYAFFQRLQAATAAAAHRLPIPIGVIAQGGAAYSGAEETAEALMALALSAGCTPVSGDMPGWSQGVIGQMRDEEEQPAHLADPARRLGERVYEMVRIMAAGQRTGSVRLLMALDGRDAADYGEFLAGARSVPGVSVDVDVFDWRSAVVAPCQACTQYCGRNGECVVQDDMQRFCSNWLRADAVAWLPGATSVGAPPALRAAIDRMNEVRFVTHFAGTPDRHMARYLKACAICVDSDDVEGTAACAQFLRHASLLYQNVLVPGHGWHQPPSSALGRRLVELAAVLQSGVAKLAEQLPAEYFPSSMKLGRIESQLAGPAAGR